MRPLLFACDRAAALVDLPKVVAQALGLALAIGVAVGVGVQVFGPAVLVQLAGEKSKEVSLSVAPYALPQSWGHHELLLTHWNAACGCFRRGQEFGSSTMKRVGTRWQLWLSLFCSLFIFECVRHADYQRPSSGVPVKNHLGIRGRRLEVRHPQRGGVRVYEAFSESIWQM